MQLMASLVVFVCLFMNLILHVYNASSENFCDNELDCDSKIELKDKTEHNKYIKGITNDFRISFKDMTI